MSNHDLPKRPQGLLNINGPISHRNLKKKLYEKISIDSKLSDVPEITSEKEIIPIKPLYLEIKLEIKELTPEFTPELTPHKQLKKEITSEFMLEPTQQKEITQEQVTPEQQVKPEIKKQNYLDKIYKWFMQKFKI